MKRLLAIGMLLVLLTCNGCGLGEPLQSGALEKELLYQAHRGLSTEYPENTMPAFQAAIENGFRLIELDPNFTADGYCVLMHDSTINRTCRQADGSTVGDTDILIRSLTYEQLQAYDAGVFKGEQFKGTKVPLLDEVAQLVKDTGVTLKIDNKIWGFSDAELETIFLIAQQYPAEIGITCKQVSQVQQVMDRLPNAIIHYDGVVNTMVCKQLREIVGDNELYIWYSISKAKQRICQTIEQYGHLGLWTVTSEAELKKAISLNADLIETNGEVKPE